LALRVFFIRALLCDYCNRQFKAFSLREPKSRGQRHSARKPTDANQAAVTPPVDLSRLKDGVKKSESLVQTEPPRRLTINLAALMLQSKTQQEVPGAIVDQRSRETDLRTQVTRLYAQGAKEQRAASTANRESSVARDLPACTHCGSPDVKRRRRTMLERLAFSVTDHKAFGCRSCGETFYSKSDEDGDGALGAPEALR
jgi:hypothetical protein